jgi:hypothetical protein
VPKEGVVIQASSDHRDKRCVLALGLPFLDTSFILFVPPSIQGDLELVNISKMIAPEQTALE